MAKHGEPPFTSTYHLHQLDDAWYGLEVFYVQPDAGQQTRLTRFCLHRRLLLPRVVAGAVAGTVHRHHGLRHHVMPIGTLGFTTRARDHARRYLCTRSCRSERRRGVNRRASKMENRTGTAAEPITGHLLYVHHGPRARRPLPLHTTYDINSEAAILPLLPLLTSAGSIGETFASNLSTFA